MARKVSLHLYLTLDGYVDLPTYPGSDHPFPDEPELLAEEMWVKRWGSIDSLLFDPLTYGQWADFWPMSKRAPGEHPWIRQMSEFAERARKVVLSGTPADTSWVNTRVLEGEVAPALRHLQSEAGGDLAVVAPGLGLELMRHGLIDEFYLAVFPVILGKGQQFFGPLENQQTLRLAEVESFRFGELFLHYELRRPA